MPITIGFDVYGTLIDTDGVVVKLRELVGGDAERFSTAWREKQLEYSFRRGLMGCYENFAVCTRQALDYVSAVYADVLSDEDKHQLLDSYGALPAFDDVEPALHELAHHNTRCFAFSNGTAQAVNDVLSRANIRHYFDGVVSVDEKRTFKPNPAVYEHFLQVTQSAKAQTWLVSSNSFDVIGAVSFGMRAVWVCRDEGVVFDPWGVSPTLRVNSLKKLAGSLEH